jgi:hypothetical protein
MSTNAFGSPDLDLRPPEMQRSTMNCWVQSCPSCGYCAGDLSKKCPPGVGVVIASPAYQAQRADKRFSELARHFLCQSMLESAQGDPLNAGHSALHAAWACDDARAAESAREARSRAADLLRSGIEAGDLKPDVRDGTEALLVDVLRRCGRFEEAKEVAMVVRARTGEKNIRAVMDHQLGLIEKGDTKCRTLAEVKGLS